MLHVRLHQDPSGAPRLRPGGSRLRLRPVIRKTDVKDAKRGRHDRELQYGCALIDQLISFAYPDGQGRETTHPFYH